MSYQPYLRNTSGVVFFGSGSDPTYYSHPSFIVNPSLGHIKSPNFVVADGGKIGSVSQTGAITIASNGNVSMTNSLTVGGDLTVNGTTTTVNSTVVTIEDPIVIIGTNSTDNGYGSTTDDNKDRGIAFYWFDGGPQIGFFGHDDSEKAFTYIPSGSFDPASGVITGPLGWAKFAGVSGDLAGNVNGNATTATTLQNPQFIGVSGHAVGSGLFDGSTYQVPNITLTTASILGQPSEAAADNNDSILIYDDSASSLKRQTRADFLAGVGAGSMSSFRVSGDIGPAHTISDNDLFVLTGGSGIQVTGSGVDNLAIDLIVDNSTVEVNADTLRVRDNGITAQHLHTSVAGNGLTGGNGTALALDFSELSTISIASGDMFAMLDSDNVVEQLTTISDLGAYLGGSAGSNITVGGDGKLSVKNVNLNVTSVSSSQTISSTVDLTTVDASSGSVTLTLPAGVTGKTVIVKKIDSSTNTVVINTSGPQIDGGSNTTLYAQWESVTLVFDSTNWMII